MKKLLFLILGLGVLIVFMRFVVIPLVMEVVSSDAFLVESKDEASQQSISTPLTDIAFSHCNTYIKSELGDDVTVSFPSKPSKAWGFGNYQFLINSEFSLSSTPSKPTKYVCRITYNNGDDQEGVAEFDNWSINGLSGLDGIK